MRPCLAASLPASGQQADISGLPCPARLDVDGALRGYSPRPHCQSQTTSGTTREPYPRLRCDDVTLRDAGARVGPGCWQIIGQELGVFVVR